MYKRQVVDRADKRVNLIQLVSFGCGVDAITTDEMRRILESHGKIYTQIKIDEIANLGAARIRVRSLLAAMAQREKRGIVAHPVPATYHRVEYTRDMQKKGYTILAPNMSPIHFRLLQPVLEKHGYHIVMLENDTRSAIDTGLKFVNNDACYPSLIVVGQIMDAVSYTHLTLPTTSRV